MDSEENGETSPSTENITKTWLGADTEHMSNVYGSELPDITFCKTHAVMFHIPIQNERYPLPYPDHMRDIWDSNHVRMPYSPMSLYCMSEVEDKSQKRVRWEIIQEALSRSITCSMQLQEAIFSYNSKEFSQWKFENLHAFIKTLSTGEETHFFTKLLPDIIKLALRLPELITQSPPLLKKNSHSSISLSQEQIACLLANAFLSTFPCRNMPWRDSEYRTYPDINFNRLLHTVRVGSSCGVEKLRCIIHYLHRVCTDMPDGVVTYSRLCIPAEHLPLWLDSQKTLPCLHITSEGTIEDSGSGLLQIDFANKMVGGGVLGRGCVQEEIRFVICPELLLARLFTEELGFNEAFLVTGCERYSKYIGYGDSFQWAGDFQDNTPRDSSRRRMCSVVAIDALKLRDRSLQFSPDNIKRELNKAYVGFHNVHFPLEKLAPVATGNWGCGAFGGDPDLKALIQLMAAAETRLDLAYFTFGNTDLQDDLYKLHALLTKHSITVGHLWAMLQEYYKKCVQPVQKYKNITKKLYLFLYEEITSKFDSASSKEKREPEKISLSRLSKVKNVSLSDEEIQQLMETFTECTNEDMNSIEMMTADKPEISFEHSEGTEEDSVDATEKLQKEKPVTTKHLEDRSKQPQAQKLKITDYFEKLPKN